MGKEVRGGTTAGISSTSSDVRACCSSSQPWLPSGGPDRVPLVPSRSLSPRGPSPCQCMRATCCRC
jgi:hypothetical protein